MILTGICLSVAAEQSVADLLLKSVNAELSKGMQWGEAAYLLIGAFTIVLLLLMLARRRRNEQSAQRHDKIDYLRNAIDMLGLRRADQRLLHRAAKLSGLTAPASMLLSPMNLARGTAVLLEHDRNGAAYRRLDEISRDLFGQPLPDLPGSKQARF